MSLIVPLEPVAKIGSWPETWNGVVGLGLTHTEAPEKAMQGLVLVTANRFPVVLPLSSTPPPPSGIGVASTFVGVIAMKASPIEANPAILRANVEFFNVFIFLIFFLLRLSIRSGFDPGFKYAIAF